MRFIDVEPQTNSSDCGVYAIAFATRLCFCEDISFIQYCVSKMRTHLVSYLEKRQMAPFSSIQRKSTLSHSIVAQQLIPISCSCRMPPAGRMIQCSHCKEQFYKKCKQITRNELHELLVAVQAVRKKMNSVSACGGMILFVYDYGTSV